MDNAAQQILTQATQGDPVSAMIVAAVGVVIILERALHWVTRFREKREDDPVLLEQRAQTEAMQEMTKSLGVINAKVDTNAERTREDIDRLHQRMLTDHEREREALDRIDRRMEAARH